MSAPRMLTAQQVSPHLVCPHCGAWAWCSFPVPVAVFTAAMRAFLVAHRPCADAAPRHPPDERSPPHDPSPRAGRGA